MSYPFDLPATQFADLIMSLAELARTKDDPFDEHFPDRLPVGKAYAFDKIKDRVCVYRSPRAKQKLRSSDAFLPSMEETGDWYFIDFKNQRPDNIQSVKDPDRNALMQKAFDSLTIAAMTFGRHLSMRQIQERSVFIVVYPKGDYSEKFLAVLGELAAIGNKPLWLLDKLTDNGFYKHVLTIDETKFSTLHLPYLA